MYSVPDPSQLYDIPHRTDNRVSFSPTVDHRLSSDQVQGQSTRSSIQLVPTPIPLRRSGEDTACVALKYYCNYCHGR